MYQKLILTLTISLFCSALIYGQCPTALEKHAVGFNEIANNSFSYLDNVLVDVRIVGYGEDTHGTSEFTTLAEKLMQYLSYNHGFKIFIIETGFGEGAYLNDYIHSRTDDLKLILEKHNSTWRYKTIEFHTLINGLRTYNQNHTDKIYLYGCEMQYVISDVSRIQNFLKKVNSNFDLKGFEKHIWQDITESEKAEYYNTYSNLKRHFIQYSETFKLKTSVAEFNQIFHHIEVLGQYVTVINQNVVQRKHDLRDLYMGENIEWILNVHGVHSKGLFWAHNAHIGDWVSNGIVDVAGHHLRKKYGSAYFNIATDFGTGSFIAFPHNANEVGWQFQTFRFDQIIEKTFTNCLNNLGSPNLFLNLRNAKNDEHLKTYLEKPLTLMSGAGAQIRNNKTETVEIGRAFDAIIYLNKTNAINWAK